MITDVLAFGNARVVGFQNNLVPYLSAKIMRNRRRIHGITSINDGFITKSNASRSDVWSKDAYCVPLTKVDFKQYQKKVKAIINLDVVILDDFLLHPITEDDEVKALYDVLEKRDELSRSCIICSQREPKAWHSMLMKDEVSSNSLLKRVTKHYIVMIERKVVD